MPRKPPILRLRAPGVPLDPARRGKFHPLCGATHAAHLRQNLPAFPAHAPASPVGRKRGAVIALAGLLLVLGFTMAYFTLQRPEPTGPRAAAAAH